MDNSTSGPSEAGIAESQRLPLATEVLFVNDELGSGDTCEDRAGD